MPRILLILPTLLLSLSMRPQKLEWNKMEHDFGAIAQNEEVETHFTLTNRGEDSIRLDNVRTTCGCTTPDWSREYIQPGDSARIAVGYDAHKVGEFYKQVKVYVSGRKRPERLFIYGEVK